VAFAQNPSGEVVGVIPDASALRPDGRWSLAVDQPVYMGDRIQTGSVGEAQINFIDDTRLVVGAASSLLIDSSVLRNRRTMKSFIVSALRGTFRFISGSSPKPAYAIRTPTATIGVRGTLFDFAVLPDGTTEFVLLEGAARVCNRGGACVTANRSCTAISVPPGGPPRAVSDIAERNARLRNYFPYIRNPTANLRPEFQADVRSCGNIAAVPVDRGQELRLEVAPAAVAPPTPPTPRPPTPEPPTPPTPQPPTPPPTVEPPTPPVVVPEPPSKPHGHHDKDRHGKHGHRDKDGRHGRHGHDRDDRMESRSHGRHRDFDRDSRGGFGHRAGDRDGFGRGSFGSPPGGSGAHGGRSGRAGQDVGQAGGRQADRGAGRARGDQPGIGPAAVGGDSGRSRGADRSSNRGQDSGRADRGHQSRGGDGGGPGDRSGGRGAGPAGDRGADRGSGRGERSGPGGWGGDQRGGDSWGGDGGNSRR
jgi:hypothetical protein